MDIKDFIVEAGEQSLRIDRYLSERCADFSRSYLQKLLKDQAVSVNGKPVKANYKTQEGDQILLEIPDLKEPDILPEDIPLDILYEDEYLMVINKPKDMVVHPSAGHMEGTLVNGIMAHCKGHLSGINGVLRPGIVHRIDKDTTGALLVCKDDAVHRDIAEQLKEHSIKRRYRAIVQGNLKEDDGTVDAPIGRHPTDRKKMCVTQRNSKNAVTHWEVVKRYRGYTHVRCRLETGRTHQIRVHMAYIGHPILGDMVYGHKKPELGQSSQCLHAGILSFSHPRDGRPVVVVAPLPDYFLQVLDKLERIS